ncbi:MAG: YkgJ family cysteine cluster protein [Deltaproteobacteria bacterium]|nr:YkgJ family cysteine cluster protein [Deltaproteobacteria bacterium]
MQKRDTFSGSAVLFYNKIKRFFIVHLGVRHVREGLNARAGECDRCGLCCKIVFECPFLAQNEDHTTCRIYRFRPLQCRAFPFHERDLHDVGYRCTYRFKDWLSSRE